MCREALQISFHERYVLLYSKLSFLPRCTSQHSMGTPGLYSGHGPMKERRWS